MRIRRQSNFGIAGRRLFVPASFLLASFGIIICRVLPATAETKGDAEKTRFAWGIKSLPWLILTDKQHNVTAEGFGLNEVNEKIEEIGPSAKTPADSIEVTGLVKGPNGQILSGVLVTEFQTDREYTPDEDGTFSSVFEPSNDRRFFFAVDSHHQFVGV